AAATALAGVNWFLEPQRAVAWGAALAFLGVMALALFGADRLSRAAEALRSGVAFGSLILVCSLGAKILAALGAMGSEEISHRVSMAILGLFVAFGGNALPKTLTPLTDLRCDPARVQALQRRAGWTFVLSGLAFSVAWLVLPIAAAEPVSICLLLGGTLLVAAQVARLRFARQRET
ncbi:MAG TPA: hypothetical protein VFS60_15340, partial [Thermoanaerobaculia bacterium]|nr:hypothetical protein [Thermoanaerobaculia bacterium]